MIKHALALTVPDSGYNLPKRPFTFHNSLNEGNTLACDGVSCGYNREATSCDHAFSSTSGVDITLSLVMGHRGRQAKNDKSLPYRYLGCNFGKLNARTFARL